MEKLTSDELTETEARTAELRARIEKQVAELLAAGRKMLEASRMSEARSRFLLDAIRGKGSGIIQ